MNTGTWTKMKLNNMVTFEWANIVKTHIRCKTMYGELMDTKAGLMEKLQNPNLLSPIRKIYTDMLKWAESNS